MRCNQWASDFDTQIYNCTGYDVLTVCLRSSYDEVTSQNQLLVRYRYEQYRSLLEKQPRLPWGRLRDYGGLQKVQLPEEFIKLKGFPPEVVQKVRNCANSVMVLFHHKSLFYWRHRATAITALEQAIRATWKWNSITTSQTCTKVKFGQVTKFFCHPLTKRWRK